MAWHGMRVGSVRPWQQWQDHSGARLLVADTEFLAPLAPVLPKLRSVQEVVAVVDPSGAAGPDAAQAAHLSYADLLGRGSDEPLPWVVDNELAAITINYTSGTTGRPEKVVDALPKTSTGTVQRFELREKEWAGHVSCIQG
jgi:acyl-CoA synthetase (AMP-forming)/AMP-acid ligase II